MAEMEVNLAVDNVYREKRDLLLSLLTSSGYLWDALDFACFQEFQARMRWFLGSRTAWKLLDAESVRLLVPLLVPRSSVSFEALFAVHQAALGRLRGDLITKLRSLMSLEKERLNQKLESPEFRTFIVELTQFKLQEQERQSYRSILEIADLKPPQQVGSRDINQVGSRDIVFLRSHELFLACNQVRNHFILSVFFHVSYKIHAVD